MGLHHVCRERSAHLWLTASYAHLIIFITAHHGEFSAAGHLASDKAWPELAGAHYRYAQSALLLEGTAGCS